MGDVTEPALFQIHVNIHSLKRRMGRDDHGTEFIIPMGPGRPMTLVTVTPLFGRMMKSGDRPFVDAVTIPAVLSKLRFMQIKMTDVTAQIRMQESVVHPGNLFYRDMFLVAKKTVPFRSMETDLGPQSRQVIKSMAVQAHIFIHPPPWSMAVVAGSGFAMHRAQLPGLCGLLIGKKPNGKKDEKQPHHDMNHFHGSHLRP